MTTHPLSESGPGVAAVPKATTMATSGAPTRAGRTRAFSSVLELLLAGSISSCKHQISTGPPGPVATPRRPRCPGDGVNATDAGRPRADDKTVTSGSASQVLFATTSVRRTVFATPRPSNE